MIPTSFFYELKKIASSWLFFLKSRFKVNKFFIEKEIIQGTHLTEILFFFNYKQAYNKYQYVNHPFSVSNGHAAERHKIKQKKVKFFNDM